MTVVDATQPAGWRDRLPLLVGIVGAVIGWALTQYYLDVGNIYLTGGGLIVLILVTKDNAWAAAGSFFTGLALELYLGGREQEAVLFGSVILFFTVLQGIALAMSVIRLREWRPRLTIGLNMTFALAGLLFGYYLLIQQCDVTGFGPYTSDTIVGQWVLLTFCPLLEQIELIQGIVNGTMTAPNDTLSFIVRGVGRFLVLFPITWGALFAALMGLRFDIRRPLRVIGHVLRVFSGSGLYAIPFILALDLLYVLDLIPEWRDTVGGVLVGIIILLIAVRMGRRAYVPAQGAGGQ